MTNSLSSNMIKAYSIAYDTQKIKQLALAVGEGEVDVESGKKYAIIGALELYLDFVNLFLYILRLLGNRK